MPCEKTPVNSKFFSTEMFPFNWSNQQKYSMDTTMYKRQNCVTQILQLFSHYIIFRADCKGIDKEAIELEQWVVLIFYYLCDFYFSFSPFCQSFPWHETSWKVCQKCKLAKMTPFDSAPTIKATKMTKRWHWMQLQQQSIRYPIVIFMPNI